jgi:hypothetical protein
MNQPTLFPPPACTCHPLCDDICRGDCGCISCQIDCGAVMHSPEHVNCPTCGELIATIFAATDEQDGSVRFRCFGNQRPKCCEKEYFRVFYVKESR